MPLNEKVIFFQKMKTKWESEQHGKRQPISQDGAAHLPYLNPS